MPQYRQHLGGKSDGLVEIPGQVRHRGQEQVAETVALQSAAGCETELK